MGMPKSPSGITERAIRDALIEYLRGVMKPGDLLVEELGVEHGSARVDVALLSDQLAGFEIKSDFDTLDRLAQQMHAFQRVFDELTIVTTPAFADQVDALLPEWWGIMTAHLTMDGTIHLLQRRIASKHHKQLPESVAALLWRDEAYAFMLEELGPALKERAPKHSIYSALASAVPLGRICQRVLQTLQVREAYQARLHVARDQLPHGEDQMMTGSVSTPRHKAA